MSETEPQAVATKPKLRWFQFSLRTLLVFVTLCVIACSFIVPSIKESLRQKKERRERAMHDEKARDALYRVGGHVAVGLTRDHGVDSVVLLTNTSVRDNDLKVLKDLYWVSGMCLDGTQITDAGLESVKELEHLKELRLVGTKVTDEGVKKLQRALPNCKITR